MAEHRGRRKEKVRGAIIVGRPDANLRSSVSSNERLSLWQYDDELAVHEVRVR